MILPWVGNGENCGAERLKIDLHFYSIYRYITNGANWIFRLKYLSLVFIAGKTSLIRFPVLSKNSRPV